MFRKKDLLLILIVLLLAGGLFLYQYIRNSSTQSARMVRIWVDGSIYLEVALDTEKDIVIRQENGCENIVHFTENGFFMKSASCDNQLCIGQGEVNENNYALRSLGTHVLCLPNRVDVELVLTPAEAAEIPDA